MSEFSVYLPGRGTGKTTACIQWMLEDPYSRVVVTASHQRAQHARSMAKDMGDLTVRLAGLGASVMSAHAAVRHLHGSRRKFVLDEPWTFDYRERLALMRSPDYQGAAWGDLDHNPYPGLRANPVFVGPRIPRQFIVVGP